MGDRASPPKHSRAGPQETAGRPALRTGAAGGRPSLDEHVLPEKLTEPRSPAGFCHPRCLAREQPSAARGDSRCDRRAQGTPPQPATSRTAALPLGRQHPPKAGSHLLNALSSGSQRDRLHGNAGIPRAPKITHVSLKYL